MTPSWMLSWFPIGGRISIARFHFLSMAYRIASCVYHEKAMSSTLLSNRVLSDTHRQAIKPGYQVSMGIVCVSRTAMRTWTAKRRAKELLRLKLHSGLGGATQSSEQNRQQSSCPKMNIPSLASDTSVRVGCTLWSRVNVNTRS